jgi:hypothetical protein
MRKKSVLDAVKPVSRRTESDEEYNITDVLIVVNNSKMTEGQIGLISRCGRIMYGKGKPSMI